ncbi:MAG: hypothetical protein QOH62_1144 [Solirubrobacteraceae bacterium]|jgi:hypothetical protein|nr:hypothetical protein [Solirubrobacteraceae bacterium]
MHDLERDARHLLERNWREGSYLGRDYAFSVPSPRSYPWQWYWDSCFHAIVRRRWEPDRARRELETLLNASDGGFIGHTIFWGHRIDRARALRYNVSSRSDLTTHTIQPPLLAWAWRISVGDPNDEPRIAEHHDWLREHRDLDGDNLLWIIQPDESGLDASPKFDHVWGRRAQGLPLFPLLIARNRHHGWDARRIRPVVCEIVTNVAWSLSEQALGRPSPTPALVERLWNPRVGRFLDEARGARPREGMADTWDTLAPLALPDLPQEIAERLIEEVLRAPRYAAGVPLPAVALDDPAHTDRETWWGRHRHWRGPSWVNSAWLVTLGLRRLGLDDEADSMAQRLAGVMEREGFREYYESHSGRGMGARDFGWSTLIAEMLDPCAP